MRFNLIAAEIEKTIASNRATSYGLTTVIGMPFAEPLNHKFEQIQQSVEGVLPGRFTWYRPKQCHATLVAPVRGIYRETPPLTRESLPNDLAGLARQLNDIFSHTVPYTFSLGRVHLTPNGLLVVEEKTLGKGLSAIFQRYAEFDHPKNQTGLHITLGYLNTPQPFETMAEQECFAELLAAPSFREVGTAEIETVRLVHYANRTLNSVVGQVTFRLGAPNSLSAEAMLTGLHISGEK